MSCRPSGLHRHGGPEDPHDTKTDDALEPDSEAQLRLARHVGVAVDLLRPAERRGRRRAGRAQRRRVAAVVRVVEQVEDLGDRASPSARRPACTSFGHAQIHLVQRQPLSSALRGITVPDVIIAGPSNRSAIVRRNDDRRPRRRRRWSG